MNKVLRIIAIALMAAGGLGLLYGGFSYTKDTSAVTVGPLELSGKEKETVKIPLWAGVAALLAGGAASGAGREEELGSSSRLHGRR